MIINLVGNAVKFTPQGEVVVRVAAESVEADAVRLRFTVRDNGIGIPADKQKLLFQPFTQADASTTRKYGGTGLGLAISQQIVELMGGTIGFESVPGEGSTFHFTVRFARQTTPQVNRVALPPLGLAGRRVLTVDDNATNRLILHNILAHWRMRATEAEEGAAALELLKAAAAAGDPIGLILLDVMMPIMDGFQTLEEIRRIPEIDRPVILMLSSDDRPGNVARASALGADLYVIKPIRPAELLRAITKALGIRSDLSDDPSTKPPAKVAVQGRSLKILVAEDNRVNQLLALRTLEKEGHRVTVANNGEAALACLANETFDLILMDVQMPVMDGFEATVQIRHQEEGTSRHLPIVAMTAHAMKGDREKCLKAGMDGYVSKPIEFDKLFAAIAEAVPSPQPQAETAEPVSEIPTLAPTEFPRRSP